MTASNPRHALVRTPIAPMYAEPHVTSIQISQRLCGHEVELLEVQDDWHLVRGIDAYEGWIHRGFLAPAPAAAARRSALLTRISLGCITELPGGGVRALPLGARLSPAEKVRSGEVIEQPELAVRFPRVALPITRSAQTYFEGASYLWGGITPWGADCSGFVQTVFALHGVDLPRDAWQQARVGDALDPDPAATVPGDLLFFTEREDRRITHVGVATGEGRMAHLALGRGGWAVDDLAEPGDDYAAALRRRLVEVRRVL